MPIHTTCPGCGLSFLAGDDQAGRPVACPQCGAAIVLADFRRAAGRRRVPVWAWFAAANAAALLVLGSAIWALLESAAARQPAGPDARTAVGAAADGAAKTATPTTVSEVIERVQDGIVLITVVDSAGDEVGFGSGFVIDPVGLIATNYHVMAKAATAHVQFRDGTRIAVVGFRAFDPDGDLAILEIGEKPARVQVLALAAGQGPRQGSEVIAIGHPQGFKFTTTTGVVSALHRGSDLPGEYRNELKAPDDYVWIQSSAAISGGSSGGPLLNLQGEVVGINTWVDDEHRFGFAAHAGHLAALKGRLQEMATPLKELAEPEERLDKLVEEYNSAYQWFVVRARAARTEEERKEVMQSPHPAPLYAAKFFDLADRHRKSPAAFRALFCACEVTAMDASSESGASLRKAADRIAADHVDEKGLEGLLVVLARSPHDEARNLLRKLTETSDDHRIQGLGYFFLAASTQESGGGGGPQDAAAIALLERVVTDFSAVEFGSSTLGDAAEPRLFVLRHLSIGKTAPEIVGQDVEGAELKLSDFRGKVVLLDFWADWCPHCVAMYPRERLLVEKYRDQPFVILGVNGDQKDQLKGVIERKQVTWRSWWDGPGGPIRRQWHIEAIPAIYLLDHEGVIRFKNVRGDDLDRAVDELVGRVPAQEAAAPADPGAQSAEKHDAPANKAD